MVTGLLMTGDAEYHRVFWVTTVFTTVVIIAVLLVVPARPRTRRGRSIGRVRWGWLSDSRPCSSASPRHRCGLDVGPNSGQSCCRPRRPVGVVALGAPVRAAAGIAGHALRGPILLTNIATVLVGTGLYFGFLGVTSLAQSPIERAATGSARLFSPPVCCSNSPAPWPDSRPPSSADGTSIDSVRAQF